MVSSSPTLGTRTIAEVNYRLLDATRAGGPACPDVGVGNKDKKDNDPSTTVEFGENDIVVQKLHIASRAPLTDRILSRLTSSNDRTSSCVEGPPIAGPMAWHPRLPVLAAVSPTDDSVHLYDFDGKIPLPGHLQQHTRRSSSNPPTAPPTMVIRHPLLQGASRGALSWRPGGFMLAVGCDCGVCLLRVLSSGPRKKNVHLEVVATHDNLARIAGVTGVTWHPEGQLLAAVVDNGRSISIIDASTGSYVSLNKSASVGLGIIHTMSWSPCGSYLLTAGDDPGGSFRIWETRDWKYRTWVMEQGGAPGGGGRASASKDPLVAAAWSPDGKFALLAHRTSGLSTLQFASDPVGSLNAQVLPITLPFSAQQASPLSSAPKIRTMAWDPKGKRLALVFEERDENDGMSTGLVVLYDTNSDPIFSAHLIGYAATGMPLSKVSTFYSNPGASGSLDHGGEGMMEEDEPDWEIVEPEVETEEDVRRAMLAKKQEAAQLLAFMPEAPYGAVLSVRSAGGRVSTIPMYFAPSN